jgi:hypothetical protein
LTDYGFEFEGLSDDYDLKNKHSFTIYYPDNPYLLHVLKSFGSLHTKAVAVDYRYLLLTEDNIKLNNFYEIEDIYKILLREEDKDFLYSIHSKLTNRGYRFTTVSPIAPYNGVSYKYDDGEEMLLFEISHSDVLSIKFTPRNIKAYSDKINLFSMKIRDILLNGQNCINCGRCKNPASFVYEGKIIKKCIENKVWRPRFTDLNKDDRESILMMLDCETTKM